MRKRRCFADSELDAMMLEREPAQTLVTVPQRSVLFRLPVTACQPAPPPKLACRRPDDAAVRLVDLVKACWTRPPAATSRATTTSGCRPIVVGQTSKSSGVGVCGTHARLQPPVVNALLHAGWNWAGGVSPTLGHSENQRPGDVTQDCSSALPGSSPVTRTHTDSDRGYRRLESKSSRSTKTFDFSVEALLAK